LLEVGDQLKERYRDQALKTSKSFLLSALTLANECDIHYKMAKNQRLHVEICLAKIAYIQRKIELNPSTLLSTEKKTSELSGKPGSAAIKGKIEVEEQIEKHDKVSNIPKEIKVEIKGPKPQKTNTSIPSIGKLEDLVNEVAAEESSKAVSQKKLNLEEINKMIAAYIESNNSPSISSILNSCIVSIIENRINIVVPTQVSKETIYQENELLDKIRNHYHKPDLRIDIEVDRDKFPDFEEIANQKPLTPKEKLEKLATQNPLVNELARRFDLRPDTE
jgi:DNA polymerase-3 subunit gamma/tau